MAKYNPFIICIVISCFSGCQKQTPEAAQQVSQEMFAAGPQLVKIQTSDPTLADSLVNQGIDVIVQEKNYLVIQLSGEQAVQIQNQMLSLQAIKEEDLVQRLIEVVVKDSANVAEINNIGITIWETRGDTVVAQAYDKYIREIEAKGMSVRVLENDILNTTKKVTKK